MNRRTAPLALDYSGHRNGGWLEKARRTVGFEGSALVCDGGSVLLPRSPMLGELQKFTVECRVRTDVAAQDNRWLVNSVVPATTPPAVFGWGCCVANPVSKCRRLPGAITSAVTSRCQLDDGCIWLQPSTAPRCDSTWTAKSAAPCPARALLPTDGRFVLGNYELDHRSYFEGLLDDVRIYRRVLSGDDIRANASRFK